MRSYLFTSLVRSMPTVNHASIPASIHAYTKEIPNFQFRQKFLPYRIFYSQTIEHSQINSDRYQLQNAIKTLRTGRQLRTYMAYNCGFYVDGDLNIHLEKFIDSISLRFIQILETFNLGQYVAKPKGECFSCPVIGFNCLPLLCPRPPSSGNGHSRVGI